MSTLTKEEYLKRYLSSAESSEYVKKKKKSKRTGIAKKISHGLKIVDDDVSWDSFTPKPDEFDEVNDKLLTNDERPQIENIEVKTEEEKQLDQYRGSKMWKTLGADNSKSDINPSSSRDCGNGPFLTEKRKNKAFKDKERHHLPRPKKSKLRDKLQKHDSGLDITRSNESSSDSDLDIIRSNANASSSDSDLNIIRSNANASCSDSDLDVARSNTNNIDSKKSNTGNKKHRQMESGGRGGLTSVDLLRLEMKKLEKKETAIKKLASEYKNTETVYRERGSGKKRDIAKEKKDNEEELMRKQRKEEQYSKWGKGLKQAEMQATAIADTLHESNKTLTRYNDDEDLEAARKAAIRDGDPMAEYFARKKRKEQGNVEELHKYKGPAPAPNRFNILPGYRWDGVDRSNGFEKKYFLSLSDRQAYKDEYYKWSVGDM